MDSPESDEDNIFEEQNNFTQECEDDGTFPYNVINNSLFKN